MFHVPQSWLSELIEFELIGVKGLLFWGVAAFFKETQRMDPQPNGDIIVHAEVGGIEHTDEGPYLVLMARTDYPDAEEQTRSLFRAVVGLLRLSLGRNAAVDHVGDLVIRPRDDYVTSLGHGFNMLSIHGRPDLSSAAFEFIGDLSAAVPNLEEHDKNRVELSLQWLFRAQETIGIDGFLMYWIALEALAMPDREIAALEDAVGQAYGLTRGEVKRRFRLGRLYGLRGNIVHQGAQPTIFLRLLGCLGAIYWDILLHQLGLPPRNVAEAALNDGPVDDWFPKPSSRKARKPRKRDGELPKDRNDTSP
jgi:hypothetical protein